ncbi:MAG: hypothetical protein K2Q26_15110 [Bdellovibrionales bacterium]|nr:hypothetical protein [Bdellovibrionales bacterium]
MKSLVTVLILMLSFNVFAQSRSGRSNNSQLAAVIKCMNFIAADSSVKLRLPYVAQYPDEHYYVQARGGTGCERTTTTTGGRTTAQENERDGLTGVIVINANVAKFCPIGTGSTGFVRGKPNTITIGGREVTYPPAQAGQVAHKVSGYDESRCCINPESTNYVAERVRGYLMSGVIAYARAKRAANMERAAVIHSLRPHCGDQTEGVRMAFRENAPATPQTPTGETPTVEQ